MKNLDIKQSLQKISKKEKKLQSKKDKLRLKEKKLDKIKANLAYKFYKEFVDKNRDNLNKNKRYYHLYIQSRKDSDFTIDKVSYESTYSNNLVKFRPIGSSSIMISMFLDEKEEEYESDSAIIDENQLAQLEKEFKLYVMDR